VIVVDALAVLAGGLLSRTRPKGRTRSEDEDEEQRPKREES